MFCPVSPFPGRDTDDIHTSPPEFDALVPWHILPVAVQRAQRGNGTVVPPLGGFLEQRPGRERITPAAATVDHHLRERHLRFCHPRSGRPCDPSPTFLGVRLHAAPLDQHPSIVILRVH